MKKSPSNQDGSIHSHCILKWYVKIFALCLTVSLDCGYPVGEGIKSKILLYDKAKAEYYIGTGEIYTITDLARIKGTITQLYSGASFVVNEQEITQKNPKTIEELVEIIMKDPGREVKFSAVMIGDTYHPTDFHSLNMISIYHNLEKASLFFQAIGVGQDEIGFIPTYYFPLFRYELSEFTYEMVDNAMFSPFPGLSAFFFFRFDELQRLPLGMNIGVTTHEFSHAVFHHIVFDADLRNFIYYPNSAFNFVKSVDEGCADFFASTLTDDPNFIRYSVPAGYPIDRNLEGERVYTSQMRYDAMHLDPLLYDPYQLGSVWASALWDVSERISLQNQQLSPSTARMVVAMALIDTLRELSEVIDWTFKIEMVVNLFASAERLSNYKDELCEVIYERFRLIWDKIEHCNGTFD